MSKITLSELDKQTRAPAHALDDFDPDKVHLDTEQVFLLYTTFLGDADQTAAALGVPGKYVAKIAEAEGWDDRIRPILQKAKSKRPGDVERAINRALCFVQSHRYRMFLERVMRKMLNWSDEQLDDFLIRFEPRKGKLAEGQEPLMDVKINARALADFAVALEKAHQMTYMALNDSTPERSKRTEDTSAGELSLSAIHAQLAQGMAGEPKTGVGQLAAAQIEQAQAVQGNAVLTDARPEPSPAPYDRE